MHLANIYIYNQSTHFKQTCPMCTSQNTANNINKHQHVQYMDISTYCIQQQASTVQDINNSITQQTSKLILIIINSVNLFHFIAIYIQSCAKQNRFQIQTEKPNNQTTYKNTLFLTHYNFSFSNQNLSFPLHSFTLIHLFQTYSNPNDFDFKNVSSICSIKNGVNSDSMPPYMDACT